MMRYDDDHATACRDGFALIAVLIALGILLALAVPFLLRMGHGESSARQMAHEKKTGLLVASARELLLREVERGHAGVDESPLFDGTEEFPSELRIPEAFAELRRDGVARHEFAGETYDLQRRINLNSATPLVLANLLGLATHLRVKHPAEVTELSVDSTESFPDSGFLVVDRELIRYGSKTPSSFNDLERGVMLERGFASAEEHEMPALTLVLDFRVVLAATHSFYFAEDGPKQRRPWTSIDELTGVEKYGFGGFAIHEIDALRANCTVGSVRETTGEWGRSERVFSAVPAGTRSLRVRSATFIGGGTVVRIRSLDGKKVEYGMVWSTEVPPGYAGNVNLPAQWFLNLLLPLSQDFAEIETVVEPLMPHPVNINTAGQEVLAAIIHNVRAAPRATRHEATRGIAEAPFSAAEAADLAMALRALRGDEDVPEEVLTDTAQPFSSFEDLSRRFFWPRLEEADAPRKNQLMRLYRVFRTGSPGAVEMGTLPVCFASAPIVHYRAAALRHLFGRQVARREVQGEAVVMPGHEVDLVLGSQAAMEEAFRIDRRSPFYQTLPINLGSLAPMDRGADPASRYLAHVLPKAWPDVGFGQPRFASPDANGAGFRAAPSTTAFRFPRDLIRASDTMWHTQHPEGVDVAQEGPYTIENAAGPAAATDTRDHRARFAFTDTQGTPQRHAVSFWFKPRQVADQMLFDLAADAPLRNRITVQVREQQLLIEVHDEAGQDPDNAALTAAQTSPEITAGTWRVPLQDLPMEADTWYHVNFSAEGTRPGQLSLLIDGVPRGEPELRTYLAAAIPAYNWRNARSTNGDFRTDAQRFLDIRVEDASTFPQRGVLRIGLELFEYSSRTDTTFRCEYVDSIGGRFARMDLFEFRPGIPVDGQGYANTNPGNIGGSSNDDITPEHTVGAAVELYGYATPLYRNSVVQVGAGQLSTPIGAFAVARLVNQDLSAVSSGRFVLGQGIDDREDELELGNPVPLQDRNQRPSRDIGPANDRILSAFPTTGGYAILVQRQYTITDDRGGVVSSGGIELIRYAQRAGNKLTGVQRGINNPHTTQLGQNSGISGIANNYVIDWRPIFGLNNSQFHPNQFLQLAAFVVPISVPARGNFADPTALGRSEWIQIHSPSNEADTEWVRYDWIFENAHLARAMPAAWSRTWLAITQQNGPEGYGPLVPGQQIPAARLDAIDPFPVRRQLGIDYIGYTDQIEVDYGVIAVARQALQHRGDPLTRTTSHAQPANATVLPVHRLELDWGNYGALTGRAGRKDRVALIAGSQASGAQRPDVEWHTVNWAARRPQFDNDPGSPPSGGPQPGVERLGAYPFQLFALSGPVTQLFIGPEERDPQRDPRLVDRLVKFPSGERPAAMVDSAWLGASRHDDAPPSASVFDELSLVGHLAAPLALDQPLAEDGRQFVVRTDLQIDSRGVLVVGGDQTARYPAAGGLVAIDGEILAYRSHSSGTFEIAAEGRGLLGTEPRAHAPGALIHFLDHVPAAILSAGVGESSNEIVVDDMGYLPPHGGTLLVGRTELLHYCWSYASNIMGMPAWADPERGDSAGRGLLRGRYGTAPASAQAGEPVIWFPFRYWDRAHARADDPELGYFQVTWNQAPVFFTGLYWQEDEPDPLVDMHCLVRINGQGSFADDPTDNRYLLRFTDGSVNDGPNPIMRQASRLEARFFPVYRAGAFDSVTFRANAWKRTPTVRATLATMHGETRILSERVTAR